MNELDILLARAQIRLATIFALIFFSVLMTLLLSFTRVIQVSAEANILLTAMTGVLGTIVTQQQGYFFARHRPPAVDPAIPSSTTTTTTGAPTP